MRAAFAALGLLIVAASLVATSLVATSLVAASPAAAKLRVVAAEAVYGDLARQIGGNEVDVVSLITNPATDPHNFEPPPSAARAVAAADITIENGLGYDPWMEKLVATTGSPAASHLIVAQMIPLPDHPGSDHADPHLWFDIATMQLLDISLVAKMRKHDPANGDLYQARGDQLTVELGLLAQHVSAIRADHANEDAAETEPVFSRMLAAMGMHVIDTRFAVAVMNGTEPRASDVAALQDALEAGHVRVLVINAQITRPATVRLAAIARAHHVPVVAVSETLPADMTYQSWINSTLDRFAAALPSP